MSTRLHTDGKVIIVAVRGSKKNKMMDWLVNFNAETTMAPEVGYLLEPHIAILETYTRQELPHIPAEWHKGFLAVAQDMKDRIFQSIDNALPATATVPGSTGGIHLLFTGHSAGGAVAKLLYAMSASQNPNMSRVITSTFMPCPPSMNNLHRLRTVLIMTHKDSVASTASSSERRQWQRSPYANLLCPPSRPACF